MTPSAYPTNAPPGSAPYPTTQGAPPPYPGGPNTAPNVAPGYPTQYPPAQVSLEFGVDNGRINKRNKIGLLASANRFLLTGFLNRYEQKTNKSVPLKIYPNIF